jgi:hypothetical protein
VAERGDQDLEAARDFYERAAGMFESLELADEHAGTRADLLRVLSGAERISL